MKARFTRRATLSIALAAAFGAAVLPATEAVAGPGWFSNERVQGNGSIKKQVREVSKFSGVSFGLPGSMEVRLGNTEGVTVEADDNLLPMIETVVENGTLKVRPIKKHLSLDSRQIKVIVTAKEIDSLSQGGSGTIESDALKGQKLTFNLGGSGAINVKGIEANAVAVAIGGSGNFKVGNGWAHKVTISIAGSGDVQLGDVKASDVSVSVAGSGQSTVWAKDSLSYTIAGSGDINYYGDPRISKTVIGSGGANRLGAK
jgi:hypothetical protein